MAACEIAESEGPKTKQESMTSGREGKLSELRKSAFAFHKELCQVIHSLVEGKALNKREAAIMRKVSNLLVLCLREAATGEATVRMLRGNNLIRELDVIDRGSPEEAKTEAKPKKKAKNAKAKAKQQRRVEMETALSEN